MAAVRRLGDFPSKSSVAEADALLTDSLSRWQARGSAAAPSEVSAIFRRRAFVRLRGGSREAAFQDLASAMAVCEAAKKQPSVAFEELPKVLSARAEALAGAARWQEALADYDRAAELLGEPLEDAGLLSSRGAVRRRLGRWAASAEDHEAAAALLRRAGSRAEAEIEAEHAAMSLLGAGSGRFDDAEKGLCGVIQRSIGLLSEDVALLQRVVIADVDARVAMAAVAWRRGRTEVAETYWRDARDRLDALVTESQGPQRAIGFPNGETYRLDRYASDTPWLRSVQGWPEEPIAWLSDFLSNRPGTPPRASFLQDLAVGKRPGEGSTVVDYFLATDTFRRRDSDGVER